MKRKIVGERVLKALPGFQTEFQEMKADIAAIKQELANKVNVQDFDKFKSVSVKFAKAVRKRLNHVEAMLQLIAFYRKNPKFVSQELPTGKFAKAFSYSKSDIRQTHTGILRETLELCEEFGVMKRGQGKRPFTWLPTEELVSSLN